MDVGRRGFGAGGYCINWVGVVKIFDIECYTRALYDYEMNVYYDLGGTASVLPCTRHLERWIEGLERA